jgi:hypothetical protein
LSRECLSECNRPVALPLALFIARSHV